MSEQQHAAGDRAGPLVLIANPAAGKGRGARALAAVEQTLRAAGVAYEVRQTGGPGEGTRLAAAATREGVETLVTVGGDGSFHEVLAGVLAEAPRETPTLGLIPVGTGNDYARMLGLSGDDPAGAARTLLEGRVRAVDVGRLEGGDAGPEHFCNNVGLAFMAAANAAHERARFLPGRLSYSLGGVASFLAYRAERLEVWVDDVALEGRFLIVHIAIGRYCGGGICLTPGADIDAGEFHVCLLPERSKVKAMLQWSRIAAGERVGDMEILTGTRVRVHGARGFLIHADGEVRRVPTGVLEATLRPKLLRVRSAI